MLRLIRGQLFRLLKGKRGEKPENSNIQLFNSVYLVLCRYDKQLQQIDGTLSTIEMQREALEGANTNTAVLTTMNDAAKALKKANADLDVDKVDSNDNEIFKDINFSNSRSTT